MGVRYYAVFDPLQQIQGKDEMNSALLRVWSIAADGYTELTPNQGITLSGQSVCLNAVGIGLTLWEGQFEEEVTRLWLRWCDRNGQVIPTGEKVKRLNVKEERLNASGQMKQKQRHGDLLNDYEHWELTPMKSECECYSKKLLQGQR